MKNLIYQLDSSHIYLHKYLFKKKSNPQTECLNKDFNENY